MKQTTIQFEKKKNEPVTIQRLQEAVDLVSQGFILSHALHKVGLKGAMGKYLVAARILGRYDGKTVFVVKSKLDRKDYYRVMELQTKYHQQKNERRKLMSFYQQKKDSPFIGRVPLPSEVNLPKADTDMQELLKLSESKIVRTAKPRVRKKAVALPWWKRFLLYLLNQ